MVHGLLFVASNALGIGAASFWSEAEKDIAESPTAKPERPERRLQDYKTTRLQVFFSDAVMWLFSPKKQFREDSCNFVDYAPKYF